MKRTFRNALVIVLLLAFSLTSIFTYADSDVKSTKGIEKTSYSINEYELVKKLKTCSDETLKEKGYSDSDIKEIKTIDFAERIKERAKLSDKQLKELKYTDEQIQIFRNFSGSEKEMIALAATVNGSVMQDTYYYDSAANRTYFTLGFSWYWSSLPFVALTDIVGIGWTEFMYLNTSTTYTYEKVMYVNCENSADTYYSSKISAYPNSQTGTCSFKHKATVVNSSQIQYWSESGYGYVKLDKSGRVPEVGAKMSYGHGSIGADVSLSFPWGIGFTFKSGVTEMYYAIDRWFL
jgi:hypothetical protein